MISLIREGAHVYLEPAPPPEVEKYLREQTFLPTSEDLNRGLRPYRNGVTWLGSEEKIASLLDGLGVPYRRERYRVEPSKIRWKDSLELWPTQRQAVDALYEAESGVLVATTGSGKTVMGCDLICRLSKPTLIVVYQGLPHAAFLRSLKRFTKIPSIGAVGDGHCSLGDVVVATVNSCTQHLRDPNSAFAAWMREEVQCVIFDEAHHSASDGSLEVLRNLRNLQHLYAMTATYRRDDERSSWLTSIFGEPVYRISYKDNIDAGTLTPITVRAREVPPHDFGYMARSKSMSRYQKAKAYAEVYREYIINGITGRNQMIVDDVLREVAQGRTVAVIVSRVDHADILYAMLEPHGAQIMVQSGVNKMTPKNRAALVQNFENREFPILISTVLDEAVDIPSLDTVVLAGGGKSTVKAEQRVRCSRGCKELPNGTPYRKTRGYVYVYRDHTDWLSQHYWNVKNTLLGLTTQHPDNYYYEQRNGKWFRLRAKPVGTGTDSD